MYNHFSSFSKLHFLTFRLNDPELFDHSLSFCKKHFFYFFPMKLLRITCSYSKLHVFFFLLTFVINTSKNSSFESERGVASDLVAKLILTRTNIGQRKEIKKLGKTKARKKKHYCCLQS